MSGVMAAIAGGGGFAGVVTAPNASPSSSQINTTATATFALNNTGAYTSTGEAGGNYVNPTSLANQLEARLTYSSGTAVTGSATGAWLNLGTNRSWSLSSNLAGFISAVYTLEIRDAGTLAVLSTSTINFSADSNTF